MKSQRLIRMSERLGITQNYYDEVVPSIQYMSIIVSSLNVAK